MKRFLKWGGIVIAASALLTAGILVYNGDLSLSALQSTAQAQSVTDASQTVKIQSAADVIGRVSASGNIGLVETNYVVMDVAGTVSKVDAKVGEVVKAGDALITLNTVELERSVRKAELNVAAAKNSLAQLQEPASANEIVAAEAELLSAQKKLEDAQKPASSDEISAAKASVNSAWSKYNELLAPNSAAETTKLEASLRKAEITMAEKQRAYDKIKWRNDVGMTSEAAALQQATIEYEAAKADYEVSSEPASNSDVQSALSSARNAEEQLNDLLAKPDEAEIASAEATVASAQKKLDDLKSGTASLEVEASQIKLDQALVDLEEAYTNLSKAKVLAPVDGVVLSLDSEKGQRVSAGTTVATLADISQLQLKVNVAEVDIDQITLDQEAEITIDALPGKSFSGKVAQISPLSSSASGVVNYEVTILLDSTTLAGVRPDMTAVAKVANNKVVSGWLVPTNSITLSDGKATITLVRNGAQQQVEVTTGDIQGEWTVVESPQLQSGDSVVGSLTTYINDSNNSGFGPPGGGRPGG